jgi:hypothetical protein
MPRLPDATPGERVSIKGRPLQFSFWPMHKGQRRFGLQSSLFAVDPWTLIRENVRQQCPHSAVAEATSSVNQAADFFRSAQLADISAARPLQLYYCFMNLVKALILTRGQVPTFDQAQHGLSERIGPGGVELRDAYLDAFPSPSPRSNALQVFAELHRSILGTNVTAGTRYDLTALLPQILPGHRLWAEAAGKQERFISLYDVRFMEDRTQRNLWIDLIFIADDLTRFGISHKKLLAEAGLLRDFREVKVQELVDGGRRLIRFEQIAKSTYTHRAADEIQRVVDGIKSRIWVTINAAQPYRRYYVYLAPQNEAAQVLPQILAIYAITYYLGSITRYRPQHFQTLLAGSYGPRIEEFITVQPLQFVYLVASEFAEKEITKPALV